MGNYTTQIRFICESIYENKHQQNPEEILPVGFNRIMTCIQESVNNVFAFDWPIFNEEYRVPLEVKILRHFYTREISEETFGLWQLRLCDRLNVIMPYYNKLYESELLKFNPFYDVDLTTEHERANDGFIDKSERADFTRSDSTERDNKKNAMDDGVTDTDSVGSLVSGTTTTNSETSQGTNSNSISEENNTNSSTVSSSNENSTSNTKNWGSNVSSGSSENVGTSDAKNVNRYSDTPQGNVNIGGGPNDGNPSAESIFGNGYLTTVTIVDEHGETKDKSTTQNSSDETNEGVANQEIGRNDSTDGVLNQSGNRSESGTTSGSKTGSGSVNKTDTKKDKANVHTSNLHDSTENEKIVGSGTHRNDVVGKIKNLSTEDFIQRVTGKRGGLTYSKMLDEFRKTFLNIDRMVLNDLESLFMGLWE